jgi:hypothetical protein
LTRQTRGLFIQTMRSTFISLVIQLLAALKPAAHPTAFTDRSVPAACLRMLAAGCPAVTLDFTPIGRRSAHTQPATRAPSWHRCCRCRDNSARGATITRIPPGGHRVAISLVAREFPGEWLVCIVPAHSHLALAVLAAGSPLGGCRARLQRHRRHLGCPVAWQKNRGGGVELGGQPRHQP